jgi:hypothetical protein
MPRDAVAATMRAMTRPHTAAGPLAPLVFACLLVVAPVWVLAQGGSRGELLYATHCHTCHTEKMHWRAEKKAIDWPSLKVQVQRWQGNASLGWGDDDVVEVARYLNARFYRFAPTGVPRGALGGADYAAACVVLASPRPMPKYSMPSACISLGS